MKSLAFIVAFVVGVAHADFFRNDFLPVGHVRTDAILNQDCLSDHVHTFYGPPLLYPKVTYEDLRNSDPTLSSGNIEENLSLYWHPSVYNVAADGTKTLREPGTQPPLFTQCFTMIFNVLTFLFCARIQKW